MAVADLGRLRSDLLAFSDAIGWGLTSWQAEALRLERRVTTCVAPRQTGKSRSLAVLALHRAFAGAGSRCLLVSAGEDASRRLLAECASVAAGSPLLSGSVVDETAGLLTLTNGSEVRSVPASERQIRGWAVDCLIADEAALIADDLLLNACIPTTAARPHARIVLASSPASPEGAFHSFARQGDEGSPHVQTFHWRLEDASWIERSAVESAREALAPAAFAREMEGLFADVGADERVITRDHIEAAQGRELLPVREPVFGVDVARHGGDESVIVRLQDGVARVVWSARGLESIMPIVGAIGSLSAAERDAPVFHIDADGMGWGVVDRAGELGLRVVAYQGAAAAADSRRHANVRAQSWWTLRQAFEAGGLDLDPGDRVMAAQLGQQTYQLASSGAVQITSKDRMRSSPDRADALVIAVAARAAQVRGERFAALVEDGRREMAEAEPVSAELDPDWAGQLTLEEAWGEPRRGWKARMGWDDSLPEYR